MVLVKEYAKAWRIRNTQKVLQNGRKHRQENKEKYKVRNRLRQRKKRENIQFKLSCNLRSRLVAALHGGFKSGSAISDMGCSIAFLKQHLESQFLDGMNWSNYGKGNNQWSIDHIYPLSGFNLQDRTQFLKACHFTNLRPMWHKDNLKKGNKK